MAGRDEAVHAAELALSRRYPEADAAFLAGSIVRGDSARLSDVDLVVLYASLPNARRDDTSAQNRCVNRIGGWGRAAGGRGAFV